MVTWKGFDPIGAKIRAPQIVKWLERRDALPLFRSRLTPRRNPTFGFEIFETLPNAGAVPQLTLWD